MNILLMSWFFPPTIGGIPSLLDTLLKTWQGNEFSTRNFRTSVLDVNYPISVCLNNVAKTTVCFCWTNLVSIIEVANSNVK